MINVLHAKTFIKQEARISSTINLASVRFSIESLTDASNPDAVMKKALQELVAEGVLYEELGQYKVKDKDAIWY